MNNTQKTLDNRVAIVTGGGGAIGAACATALAEAGAKVVVADLNLAAAERIASAIRDNGGEALALEVDLASEDSIIALHQTTLEHYGRIDILHNNAADVSPKQMAADGKITEIDIDVWDRAFNVNTRGTLLMIKHSTQVMLDAGGGCIINTSSGVALLGDTFNPAYSSSKGAINSLTRNVAAQFGKNNIRCNAVLPGLILTEHSQAMLDEAALDMLLRHTLLPRLGAAEDIAAMVVFLASDSANFITGQLISVDGGLQSHQPWVGEINEALTD